jgi:hypothetical protein
MARVARSRRDAAELRELLERLLKAVKTGELDASSSRAKALLRRLEGARAALGEIAPDHARRVIVSRRAIPPAEKIKRAGRTR